MPTLANIKTQLLAACGVPVSDGFYDSTRLTFAIREAMVVFEAEAEWDWMRVPLSVTMPANTVTCDVGVFALVNPAPSAYSYRVASVAWRQSTGIDAVLLEQVGLDEVLMVGRTGEPDVWAASWNPPNAQIALSVAPKQTVATTYQLVVLVNQPGLNIDTDYTTTFPDRYIGAVVEYAAGWLAAAEGDQQGAAGHMDRYRGWVERAKRSHRVHRGPSRPKIRPGAWW